MRVEGSGATVPELRSGLCADAVRSLLGIVRGHLGLDVAWLASFHDEAPVLEVVDGPADAIGLTSDVRQALSDAYYRRMTDERLPTIVQDADAGSTLETIPNTGGLKLAAYVAIPVLDQSGAPKGIVCAANREPLHRLTDNDLSIARQAADLIGTLLDSPDSGQTTTPDQRAAIRKMVADNDFHMVFQPIHDVGSGIVIKVEALARFSCPPFRPDAVIALATQMGLGTILETAILRRVIEMVPQLPEGIVVAANISPRAALVAPWDELLAGVDPSRIILELTEHDAVADYEALDDALQPCRERGIRIAVDDVGAGFSSFSHVLELSPEFIKMDQSITRHIDVDDARRKLAHAIAELAAQMGTTVIAEGVESQGELDTIAAVGIKAAQGFYLSRPRPLSEGFPDAEVTAAQAELAPTSLDVLGDRRFELALAHSPIGMAVVGLDGTFLRTNRALRRMLGYSKRDLESRSFQDITHPDDLDADIALLNECIEGRRTSYRMNKRYIGADGRIVWGALTVVSVHAPRNRPRYFVSQIVDVTAERIREEDLARQAATDPLTGLANRSAGWSHLEKLEAVGTGYGVLFCDIERFKAVNDRHGHRAGDQVLVAVADQLRRAVTNAELVVRWGADEFLIITDSDEDSQLAQLADHITESLRSTPISLEDGTVVSVGLTIGSATHRPGDGSSADTVVERADKVMYERRN